MFAPEGRCLGRWRVAAPVCPSEPLCRCVTALVCSGSSQSWFAPMHRCLGLPAVRHGFGLPRRVAALACPGASLPWAARGASRPWSVPAARSLGLLRCIAALGCPRCVTALACPGGLLLWPAPAGHCPFSPRKRARYWLGLSRSRRRKKSEKALTLSKPSA